MKFLELMLEGRVDDFKSKFSKKFSQEQLDSIVKDVIPKYLDWAGKNLDAINFDENFTKLVEALNRFEIISTNLPITDLYSYKNLSELIEAITVYQNRIRRDVNRVEGGNVVYDDGSLFVVNPLTYKSSCYYGAGTKWCTAGLSEKYFTDYNEDGKLFYFIDRTKPTSDPFYKVALLKKFNGDTFYFDAKDAKFTTGWIIGSKKHYEIMSLIDDYLNKEYAGQIKIFTDAALAKKEKERLERVRLQRILNGQRAEAQGRREDNEWELGPNCPDEGLKAHALLEWLSDNNDVEIKTAEDRIEIQRLKDEIERLESEYDNSEDVRTDLLDEKGTLEDELDELENKIDVYNIIPDGEHYDTTKFIVIDANLEDREYAVGTDNEMLSSCKDSVQNNIDDIGLNNMGEGVKNLLQYNIDEDRVRDEISEFYDYDVRENHDVYLDEEDRELSDKQQEEISLLKRKIAQTEELISNLDDLLNDEDSNVDEDEIKEKISELEDIISEANDEISDIEESPDGDFPEDLINDKVDELVEREMRDPLEYLTEHGYSLENYVNVDGVIDDIIEADGYGHTLNFYDGNADEVTIQNETYYVMRIN
jgi:hypothetical protein